MALKEISNNIYNRFVERFVWKPNELKTDKRSQNMALNDLMIKLEPIFVSFQSLLIWDKPYLSAIAFIVFNCLFWLIVCLSRRFYSFVAIILFCLHFYKLWANYIWPEIRVPPKESTDTEGWTPIHPQVLSAPEINHYINQLIVMFNASIRWLINLRQSNHGLFCLLTSGILFMTAIIGKLIPGVIIVYSLMMTIALGPGIALYVIPEGFYEIIRSFLKQNQKNDETDSEKVDENTRDSMGAQLNEQALHELSLNSCQFNSFELNPFENDIKNDSSLQLLSDSQLETSLDKELGIEVQLSNDEDMKICSSNSSNSSNSGRSESSSGGIHFVSTHFSRNSSTEDNIEDDYELISDTEIQDSAKDSSPSRQTSV